MEGKSYLQGGISYDRVTSILDWVGSDSLARWRGAVGNKEANLIQKAARKRGTEVHAIIEKLLKGKKVEEPEEFQVAQAIKAWREWYGRQTITPAIIEQTLYDENHLIAGTPDFFTTTELFDWKIAKRFSWKNIWQANAYLHLIRMNYPELQVSAYRIVRLDPDIGEFEELKGEYDEACVGAFHGLAASYQYWMKHHQEMKNASRLTESTDSSDEALV